jgi:hypothetical protein
MAWNQVHCNDMQVDLIQEGSSEDNNEQMIIQQELQADNVERFEVTNADGTGTRSTIVTIMPTQRVMLVVPLLNSSICYFSFTLFMCFFRCLKQKRK